MPSLKSKEPKQRSETDVVSIAPAKTQPKAAQPSSWLSQDRKEKIDLTWRPLRSLREVIEGVRMGQRLDVTKKHFGVRISK